jgi:DNA-binding CsgD family transcriptional regulator
LFLRKLEAEERARKPMSEWTVQPNGTKKAESNGQTIPAVCVWPGTANKASRVSQWGDIWYRFTRSERRVAALLLESLSDKEIGARLGAEPNAVHFHLVNIFRKLGVHNRDDAARKLMEGGA